MAKGLCFPICLAPYSLLGSRVHRQRILLNKNIFVMSVTDTFKKGHLGCKINIAFAKVTKFKTGKVLQNKFVKY